MDKPRPIEFAPEGIEVLAWHKDGRTWHQVTREGRAFRMRWNAAYHQFLDDFDCWVMLPAPPA